MDTPAIIIDHEKLDSNINKVANIAKQKQVSLRPHIKTHKIPYIAEKQMNAGATGITSAKVTEAEVMANHGIKDIFIAYPLVTEQKIQAAVELNKRIRLIVATDSYKGAEMLSAIARKNEATLEVRLEIDTGMKRTGVPYNQALELAEKVNELPNLLLTGIYTFRGPILNGEKTLNIKEAGIEEGRLMVSLAEKMRKEGLDIRDISVGSTQTSEYAADVPGITEVRPGTYVFYDTMQEQYGLCTEEECAATVYATVVSRPSKDIAIIDGGSKTFATDVQPTNNPIHLEGFGKIVGYPNITFAGMTEEHGTLHIEGDSDLQIGDTIQVIPNHICSTVNLHNNVLIRDDNGNDEMYSVAARGKLQ